jgi:hypothetical protein
MFYVRKHVSDLQKSNPKPPNRLPDSFDEFLNGKGFVISLKRHLWRGEHTLNLLKDVGFQNLEIFDAIDGFNDKTDYESKLGLALHPDVYPGARGATLSMILLYKKVIDENLPYIFVFEDDALPHKEFKTIGEFWYNRSDKNVDFLFLGSQFDPKKFPNQPVIKTSSFCLHAYCITNAGAKRAMELLKQSSISKRENRPPYPGVDILDLEVIYWMAKDFITWQNWNIEGIVSHTYEIIEPPDYESKSKNTDCIRSGRHAGLIWQNLRCGSCIHEQQIIYAW